MKRKYLIIAAIATSVLASSSYVVLNNLSALRARFGYNSLTSKEKQIVSDFISGTYCKSYRDYRSFADDLLDPTNRGLWSVFGLDFKLKVYSLKFNTADSLDLGYSIDEGVPKIDFREIEFIDMRSHPLGKALKDIRSDKQKLQDFNSLAIDLAKSNGCTYATYKGPKVLPSKQDLEKSILASIQKELHLFEKFISFRSKFNGSLKDVRIMGHYFGQAPTSNTQLHLDRLLSIIDERMDNARSLAIAVFNYAEYQGRDKLAEFYVDNKQIIGKMNGRHEDSKFIFSGGKHDDFTFRDVKDILMSPLDMKYNDECVAGLLSMQSTPSRLDFDKCERKD